jgi:hypothetical protein
VEEGEVGWYEVAGSREVLLARDLFEKIFSGDGAEVNVTRTSRDEDVDALVVDPDPLKGGKIIVHAKRYRKVSTRTPPQGTRKIPASSPASARLTSRPWLETACSH